MASERLSGHPVCVWLLWGANRKVQNDRLSGPHCQDSLRADHKTKDKKSAHFFVGTDGTRLVAPHVRENSPLY